mmetsp:Transcript_32361/g.47186  ORF Transcript_32361/g.47186 Transcript_32361/m.47186 type:complete len:89 (+) Transcript_32361:1933-2199(+)
MESRAPPPRSRSKTNRSRRKVTKHESSDEESYESEKIIPKKKKSVARKRSTSRTRVKQRPIHDVQFTTSELTLRIRRSHPYRFATYDK